MRNSNLIRAFLLQLDTELPKRSAGEDSATANPFLEKNLECMIDSIDDLSQESGRFQYYQRALGRHTAMQSSLLAKRKQENENRRRQGLHPLSDDDITSGTAFKPLPEPSRCPTYPILEFSLDSTPCRLESLLFSTQISNFCSQINQVSLKDSRNNQSHERPSRQTYLS